MELRNITYHGPDADDTGLLSDLPNDLRALLGSINGFILLGGALHVRGACRSPQWHSLRAAWQAPGAFHELYPAIDPAWIPFAQDCVGDQFFLTNNTVLRLEAETGDVEETGLSLMAFLSEANSDPVGFLSAEPLLQIHEDKGPLRPGQLVCAYPPFCTAEAAAGVSLKAVPAAELHAFHADLAKTLS